jgi:2-keto-3-deoxy-L-rhamnonate aldolase RhmA
VLTRGALVRGQATHRRIPMTGDQMRQTLAKGQRVYGAMLALARNPRWARALSGVGLDYVIIDTEHSAFSRGEVADMIAAYGQAGIAPLVRVPIPDAHYVTMAMDAGAHGVLVPYCETVEQVRVVVGASKWRPLKGALLEHAVETGDFPSGELKRYLARRNQDSFLIIGIESTPAVENLTAMLDVGGVDAVFVGPHDLSCSLGIPEQYEHPDFEGALEQVLRTCAERGVPVTVHFSDLALSQEWIRRGVGLVLHSSDVGALANALRRDFGALRDT